MFANHLPTKDLYAECIKNAQNSSKRKQSNPKMDKRVEE